MNLQQPGWLTPKTPRQAHPYLLRQSLHRAFPVQVRAELELRMNSLSTVAEQHWGMEGFRYFISVNAKKFGVKAQLESEGDIDSNGGLRPNSFRMKVNDKIRSAAEYRNGALTYGKSSLMKNNHHRHTATGHGQPSISCGSHL
jgi:hypothetical protein